MLLREEGIMATVLLMSGSPRTGGNTDDCVAYLEKRFANAGHRAQVVRVCDLKIEPCRGCRACMKLGHCAITGDDFEPTWNLVKTAELAVVAAPIYWYGPPGPMKNFIDRTHGYYATPPMLAGLKAAVLSIAGDEGCWEPHETIMTSWLKVYGAKVLPPARIIAREKGDATASPIAKKRLDECAETLLAAL